MSLQKIRLSKKDLLFLMIFILVVSKLILIPSLPAKYFYDADTLAYRCVNSYEFTEEPFAYLYHSINFFNFTTRFQWGIPLAIVGNWILVYSFIKINNDVYSLDESIVFLCCMALANVYIFQISKDFWQLLLFYVLFIVIKLDLFPLVKITLIFGLLFLEGMYFREYYKLTALLFLLLVLLYLLTIKISLKWRILIIIGISLMCFGLAKYIMPDEFEEIINVRAGLTEPKEGKADSTTLIKNVVGGSSLPVFFANYFLNFFRISIPIELLFKGAFYFPFFVFQISLMFRLRHEYTGVMMLKKDEVILNEKRILILAVIFSYYCVAVIFEPDFGSVVRHEIALYPLIFGLYDNKNKIEEGVSS